MKPTLYVMAAGMGSRYGGLKQMDGLGPNGETIIDYSIYDAIRAGFGKVVFVIRRDFAQDFKDIVISKFESKIPVEIVYQDITALPEGYTPNPERVKPWGTNHAILMGKDVVKEPFAVINGDDFYGYESFKVLADQLVAMEGTKGKYCMVGFPVKNTLSESGTVSRGVCGVDEEQNLTSMVERTKIERMPSGQIVFHDLGEDQPLEEDTPVSMNLFGFTPDFFVHTENYFKQWFQENPDHLKGEFYIPTMVNKLIADGTSKLRVLRSAAQWHGVTYKEDKPALVAAIQKMIEEGKYPAQLWK